MYGAECLICSVHNLVHITDDVDMFGKFNSFENYLGKFITLGRQIILYVQQLFCRL